MQLYRSRSHPWGWSCPWTHQKIVRTRRICAWDVIESAEDSSIKRRHPQLFEVPPGVSNGDLRAIHGILQRGYDASAIDSANLLWSKREYLSKNFPSAWYPSSNQCSGGCRHPIQPKSMKPYGLLRDGGYRARREDCEEVCAILLVKMSKNYGAEWFANVDRLVWEAPAAGGWTDQFHQKYQSSLILFLTEFCCSWDAWTARLLDEELSSGTKDVGLASELYWRQSGWRVCRAVRGILRISRIWSSWNQETRKDYLRVSIESSKLPKVKGPRTAKLELLKQLLVDPGSQWNSSATQAESAVTRFTGRRGDGRIKAVVTDRCNLFKSTAFTVLMVFLRQDNAGGLPIIFRRATICRRDSACLRVFRAIWDIWRRDGDLNLFPRRLLYGVVPLSRTLAWSRLWRVSRYRKLWYQVARILATNGLLPGI